MNSLNSSKIDKNGEYLCHLQGELFALSSEKGLPSGSFVKAFMMGPEVKTLDDLTYFSDSKSMDEIFFDVEKRVTKSQRKPMQIEVLSWIGYMYRYWAYQDKKTSREVYLLAPLSFMERFYLAGHTTDPSKALESIKNSIPKVKMLTLKELLLKDL